MTFEELSLNKQLLSAVAEAGYTEATEIQEKAIPHIMGGHDILGVAQTGTGKTAAYLLPILMKVKYAQGDNVRALIMAPTRELVMQIDEQISVLAKYTDLRHVAAYGGVGPKPQIEKIEKGVDIIVATPGRLLEIYAKGHINFKDLKFWVLDEADRMLDMGFMPQIRAMLEIIPRKRQNLLFSATFPEKVERFAAEFLEFPTRISVSQQATAASTIDQQLYYVPNFKTKINLLQHLIEDKDAFQRVIIFTRTKEHANNIFKFLERKIEKSVRVIHANKGQNARMNSMDAFKDGDVRILVATDVAARGIDITMVSHVINFDIPIQHEDYVHRIGRTGRAKHAGIAISFANKAELKHIEKIEKLIRTKIPLIQLPSEVFVAETSFEEQQEIDKEVDILRKREDPDFKGAFHEKKNPRAQPTSKRRKY